MCTSRSWALAFLQSLLVATELPGICLAQNGVQSTSASIPSVQPSSTTSAPAQTHTIQVGLADHKFKPETTVAKVGDIVEFAFYPRNHSVVRAEYGFPCIPYEMTGASKTGFFSGFHPVDKVLPSPPIYRIVINDTNPIFFYCSAPGSCLTYGMVGSINPNASTIIEEQQRLAQNSTYMLNPGEPFPAETPSPSNPPSSTVTSGSSLEKTDENKSGLSKRAIIAMVVTSTCITILAALLFFFWGRTKGLKDELKRKATIIWRPDSHPTGPMRSMSMLVPRAELGNPEPDSTMHQHQPYYYQYPHQPQPDNATTYPHQPTHSPSPQTLSMYYPPPPPSSPHPLLHKSTITSPLDPHPAYFPLSSQPYHHANAPAQHPIRHELDSQTQEHKTIVGGAGEQDAKTAVEVQCRERELGGSTVVAEGGGNDGDDGEEGHRDPDGIEQVPSYSDAVRAASGRTGAVDGSSGGGGKE